LVVDVDELDHAVIVQFNDVARSWYLKSTCIKGGVTHCKQKTLIGTALTQAWAWLRLFYAQKYLGRFEFERLCLFKAKIHYPSFPSFPVACL